MASTTSSVKPEKLSTTERAAYFHSLRVYYQIQDAANWGWKLQDGTLMPVLTDEAPAPDEIPNVIHCNCKVSSKSPWWNSLLLSQ